MKRTTIFIPEPLERDLQLYATRARRPVASVVREAIATYLASSHHAARVPSFAAVGASGRSDVATTHEELLFSGLTPHGDAPRRAGRATAKPAAGSGRASRARR